jgi:hypothetical protein
LASFLPFQSTSAEEAVERATITGRALIRKEAVIMFRKTFGALTLAAAIGGSVLFPTPALAKSSVVIRFYDNDHRDYHRWNRAEDPPLPGVPRRTPSAVPGVPAGEPSAPDCLLAVAARTLLRTVRFQIEEFRFQID